MANLKNAIKQIRKDAKRSERNLQVRADLKTLIKKTRQAIQKGEKNAEELLSQAQKSLDKAVEKRIIKKNAASRMLSRLHSLKKRVAAK